MKKKNAQIQDDIYANLRSMIFSGALKDGDRLVETRIAAQYQINKSHVHEVLQMLQADKLIKYVPMRGFIVLGITCEDLFEIAKIREVLESAIFEDFLANAREPEIAECKRLTKRKIAFLQAGLKEEAFNETCAFFEQIYSCTKYWRMVAMLRQYRDYIDIMINKAFDLPDDVAKTIENSTLLYNVLDRRDYVLAQKWIKIRYDNMVEKIRFASAHGAEAEREAKKTQ